MATGTFTKPSPLMSVNNTMTTLTVTTTTYADVGTWSCRYYKTKNFVITAVSTQDIAIKILGSYDDGSNYELTAVSSFALNSTSSTKSVTDYFTNLKVQAGVLGSTTAGTTTIAVKYCGVTF
jgi:hypothetical protein